MNNPHILIIGAGAAGLMAARTLSKAGKKVTVLEARNRCGGRIHTLNQDGNLKCVELGAEFIHGDLPITLNLLKEARISYHSAVAEMWHYKDGKFSSEGGFKDLNKVIKKLGELKQDVSLKEFLEKEFSGDEYRDLRTLVIKFVSGYDTADPATASSFALRDEWKNEDDDAQHRVNDGYGVMIQYLEAECKRAGTDIRLNTVVKEVLWERGNVRATARDGQVYEATHVLLALPLGVLQADENDIGVVAFIPGISRQMKAISAMGFGAIIKVLLEFDEPFWENKVTEELTGKNLKHMGFVLSDEEIPTWWTQYPQHNSLLTGWLGGGAAAEKINTPVEELLSQSLRSLSNIFKLTPGELKEKLVTYHIVNWTADPFTRGSYAYDTVDAHASKKILVDPIEDTIFFAGEYLYEGPAMGTVEAALTSGMEVANKVISLL
jgi:monoamine oxidase